MKKKILLIGVIALTVVIAFSMAACKNDSIPKELEGTWTNNIQKVTITSTTLAYTVNTNTTVEIKFDIESDGTKITLNKSGTKAGEITYVLNGDNLELKGGTDSGLALNGNYTRQQK